jgi:tetratricopeptide (TPR) repeat protein
MSEALTQFESTGNPFPGLRPFETEEYNLFFGREGQADELLARLGRTRFLAVVGTSGSGKSSLIKAGLLPALYGGLMAGMGSAWRIAVMRPGHDPIGNLACALSEDDVLGSTEVDDAVEAAIIETTLRRSTLGLVDAVRQARLPKDENVLVVVDQFEELFRFRSMRDQQHGTDDDASAFVKLLLEAPRQRDVSVYVVLTMRSDFLGDCSQFQGLPEAINDGQYLIPRMTRDERRSAITGPAVVGGGEISPPLVNRLLNDVGDNPDQLPILQHALMRTWEYWTAHRRDSLKPDGLESKPNGLEHSVPVGLEDYEAVGTMSNALSQHADEAFNELPDERSRQVAEGLFKSLTERGTDNRDIRRPTRLSEIRDITGATFEEVASVIEVFRREGRSFLMPPAGTPLDDSTIIDISHESLIRNWDRLKEWVRDEAESARIYRRLAGAAADYRKQEGGLLDDVTLGWVMRWHNRYHPNRAWGVRYHPEYDDAIAYLEESRAARDADAAEREQQRLELLRHQRRELEQLERRAAEQVRAARRLRFFVAAMASLSALALVAFAFALVMAKRANETKQRLLLNRHALQMIQRYEMEKAEDELNELYRLNANDDAEGREGRAWVLYNLGELNRKLERYPHATAFFESDLQMEVEAHGKLDIDSVGTLDSLAHTLEDAGNYEAAVSRFEQLSDILGSAAGQKGKYFKLNTANVSVDLANLYIKWANARNPPLVAASLSEAELEAVKQKSDQEFKVAKAKARSQYERALAIWSDVLNDDPEALGARYEEAALFFYRELGDKTANKDLYAKSLDCYARVGTRVARKPIGALNPGGDPGINSLLPTEGAGYITFNRAAAAPGLYGRPPLIDFIRNVGAAWATRHPDLKLVVGDLSHQGGGPFPPHLDHQDGREVDIWAVSNSGIVEPTNIYAPNYSRELTKELVMLIKEKYPSAAIYFDDPSFVAEGLTKATLDHDNYMHIFFP